MKFGVSLYSYMYAYENKKMDLEACLKAIKALPGNVDGVEILADRKKYFEQSPYIGTLSESDQSKWKELMAKYEMKPTCYDSSLMANGFTFQGGIRRTLNPSKTEYDQQMAWIKSEIDFCADFGFPIMRSPNLFGIYEEVIRDSLKYASDNNVKLCMEIHAPLKIKGEFVTSFAEMIDKTCPGAGGFVPDFGIFAKRLPRPLIRKTLAEGGAPELVKRIDETYTAHGDMAAVASDAAVKAGGDAIQELLRQAYFASSNSPEELKLIAKYIHHVHAKFYEVDENYVEQGIDFEGPLKVLKEIGYEGYVNSEYEGQHYTAPAALDEAEQVRRQTVMTRNILEKL